MTNNERLLKSPIGRYLVTEQVDGSQHIVPRHSLAEMLQADTQNPCKVEPLQVMPPAGAAVAHRLLYKAHDGTLRNDSGAWIDGPIAVDQRDDFEKNCGDRLVIELAYAGPASGDSASGLGDAVLAHLDALSDEAAAHILPSDLQRCMTSECSVHVASVRMSSLEERSVPLFSRAQVEEALNSALRRTSVGGLPVAQEPKYTTNGTHVVNRASGEAVPHDEPVFIVRARDALGVAALKAYLNLIGEREPASDHAGAVQARIEDFQRFAADHPDRMKWPDTNTSAPAGLTTARAASND